MGTITRYDDAGNIHEFYPSGNTTITDVNAQNNTLTIAQIVGGIVVHTSTGSPGTVTVDTGVAIIAGSGGKGELKKIGDTMRCFYINDGNQTLTLAVATGLTITDTGQTIAENASAILLFRKTSATTVNMYIIGA